MPLVRRKGLLAAFRCERRCGGTLRVGGVLRAATRRRTATGACGGGSSGMVGATGLHHGAGLR